MEQEPKPLEQEQPKRPPNPDGTFAKGGPGPPAHVRRRKGSRNRLPADIKACITEAAARIGSDGFGRDGVTGFLEAAGREYAPTLVAGLLRLVPPPKGGDGANGSSGGIVTVNICPVRSGTYLAPEEIEHLNRTGRLAPLTIDHEPIADDRARACCARAKRRAERGVRLRAEREAHSLSSWWTSYFQIAERRACGVLSRSQRAA